LIIRILGEGQWEIDDSKQDELNRLDDAVVAAVDSGDENGYSTALGALVGAVKSQGTPVAEDFLGPSDALLPSEDVTLGELRDLLGDEGLIPG
jgi:hypothetical protein